MGDLVAVYVDLPLSLLAQVPNFALAVLVKREDQLTTRSKLRHPLISTLPNAIRQKIRKLRERKRESVSAHGEQGNRHCIETYRPRCHLGPAPDAVRRRRGTGNFHSVSVTLPPTRGEASPERVFSCRREPPRRGRLRRERCGNFRPPLGVGCKCG